MRIRGQGKIDDDSKEQKTPLLNRKESHRKRTVVAALVPFIVLAVMISLLLSPTF